MFQYRRDSNIFVGTFDTCLRNLFGSHFTCPIGESNSLARNERVRSSSDDMVPDSQGFVDAKKRNLW
jgi:hypothetical protein